MLVYIVRHAIAVPREDHIGLDDASRALTDRGIDRMRRIVRGLDALGVEISEIWTSSLVRARQTAEILAESRRFQGTVRTVPALAPGGDPTQLLRELQQASARASIALVGHEPDLGEFASLLLTGKTASFIPFKKGGVACIEIEKPTPPIHGELHWLMTPKQMRSIG
jgi:phosphohistidine phosphatase